MLDVQIAPEGLSEATRVLLDLPDIFQRAKASALKSVGYQLQQELKMEAKRAYNGGYLHWPRQSPYTRILRQTRWQRGDNRGEHRSLKTHYKRGPRAGQRIWRRGIQGEPFSKLANAIRYDVDVEEGMVTTGFLETNAKMYQWLKLNAEGFTIPVTKRMRQMFMIIGLGLKPGTSQLRVPARPWVEPVRKATEGKVFKHFEAKFLEAIERYQSGGTKSSGKGWAS